MESESGYVTGIVLDFKHEDCLHDNLKMDLIQNVDSMAVWISGNQQFVILRPDSDDFQPYCLRITTRSYDSMHAYLLPYSPHFESDPF
jgi:flagellar biosynthesis regulator FlaF